MTGYKALFSTLVVAVVAVATFTLSPLVADARSATLEVDYPELSAAAATEILIVAETRESAAIPATSTTLRDHYETEIPQVRLETASSATGVGAAADDEISPSCRRVCVKTRSFDVTTCNDGECTTRTVTICCKWDLIDCYYG